MARSVANNGRRVDSRSQRATRPVAQDASNNQYRVLLASLFSLGFGNQGQLRTVGLTSSKSREGVTTVACNLALCAARSHNLRVLLIDANHSNPGLHRIFGLPLAPGLTDWLASGVSETDCVHDMSARPLEKWPAALRHTFKRRGLSRLVSRRRGQMPVPELYVMPAGHSELNAQSFCNMENDGFLERISRSFDLVIVDLPPVSSATSSGFSLASLDGLLFVLEAEATSDIVAKKSLRQLRQTGADILGVALNQCRTHLPKWIDAKLGD